ncbi:putative porin [Emticicia sp. BO119]|uniref:putative porin n=1 Tax=Emticicia sp. BO119 TaxID=2757768 RepID=UPI0015F1152A|nr:putative porin [Emticicia sp. BO119]MBA4848876.1 putative porin [Emticicia sp. BO119]
MSIKKIFFTLLLSFLFGLCHAQILDDSTKQVYGLKTTRYILEDDILNNRKTYYNPDSTLDGFHLFDRNLKSGWLYQDLGLIGTAVKPLFFQPNEEVSKQLGFTTYGFYAFDARKSKYYNTKSPYTNMYYVQSGGGMLYLDFTHSQNIKPRWNITFDVRRLTSAKQYGAPQTREERLVDSWALITSSNYESKDGKYTILGTYNHFNHAPVEQGGIKPLDDGAKFVETTDLGNYKNFLSRLSNASSRDWRNEFHIYQQYQLSNGFQVYHILDYQRRIDYYHDNRFKADTTAEGINYYGIQTPKDTALLNLIPDSLSLALRYRLIENKFGIKGIYRGFAYRLHLRHRFYNLTSDFGDDFRLRFQNEVLAGAWANYYFPDSLKRAYAEFEIGTNLNYKLKAEYISPWLNAGFTQLSTPAYILDEHFMSDAYNWNSSLKNQFSNNIYASTTIQSGRFRFLPEAHYSLIDNYIYYDTKAQVQQSSVPISIFRAGLGIEYRWKKFLLANQVYIAGNSEKDIIRMPAITNNTTIAYEFTYAKRLHINAGAEIYYRSAYYADNYMPLTRQFYLQNDKKAWGYPVVDVFTNMKISKVRFFLKFAHINQGFPASGYFVSSVYPGLRRTFFLGANWPLFD